MKVDGKEKSHSALEGGEVLSKSTVGILAEKYQVFHSFS